MQERRPRRADPGDHDPDVARWWDDRTVTFRSSLTRRIAHPAAGPLEFGIESVVGPHDPDQRLVVHTVEPDSPAARVLPMPAGWGPGGVSATSPDPATP